jgi:hypothetical protein
LNKDLIWEFYVITLIDLREGVSVSELESMIKLYEEMEDYEACAGILKAINDSKHRTIKDLLQDDRHN